MTSVRGLTAPPLRDQLRDGLVGEHSIDCCTLHVSQDEVDVVGAILAPLVEVGIPTPYLYPSMYGGIRAEWTIADVELHVDIQPRNGSLYLFACSVVTDCPLDHVGLATNLTNLDLEGMTKVIKSFFKSTCEKALKVIVARVNGPGGVLIVDPPLVLPVGVEDGWELSALSESLGIFAYGDSFESLVEDVHREVLFLWREYALASPEELSPRGKKLRELVLARVYEVKSS